MMTTQQKAFQRLYAIENCLNIGMAIPFIGKIPAGIKVMLGLAEVVGAIAIRVFGTGRSNDWPDWKGLAYEGTANITGGLVFGVLDSGSKIMLLALGYLFCGNESHFAVLCQTSKKNMS
jgi:hypothetical protein